MFARLMGQLLSDRLGQPFVIENRAGAGGNLAVEAVVKGPRDGYTLLMVASNNAWNATLYDNLSFNFIRDIAPVASIYSGSGVLVLHPSFPAKSVAELITYAKAHPGKINMASGGVGSAQHVYGELFKIMAEVKMLHVPYRGGGPALTDLLAGAGAADVRYLGHVDRTHQGRHFAPIGCNRLKESGSAAGRPARR
jgi:tripartite-type tricarboxylate transporter receptor subunit TctC